MLFCQLAWQNGQKTGSVGECVVLFQALGCRYMDIYSESSNGVRSPGLGSHWLGRERYVIRGGGVAVVPFLAGDKVELVDPEGLQSAQIAAFDSSGSDCIAKLGVSPNIKGSQLAQMIARNSIGAINIRNRLKRFDVDLENFAAAEVLKGETEPDSSIEFTCETECIAVIGAPGNPMQADEQCPPTDLIAWVTRSQTQANIGNQIPDPLVRCTSGFQNQGRHCCKL